MTVRCVIIGTHGVGKTSLAERLAVELNLPYIEEIARKVNAEGFSILTNDSKPSVQAQMRIYGLQIAIEQTHFVSGYVADRSVLDNFVYAKLFKVVNENMLNIWERFIREYVLVNMYSHIIYIPLMDELDVGCDGLRNTDLETQKKIDREIHKVIKDLKTYEPLWDFSIHTIASKSFEDRVNEALEFVR